MEGGTTFHLLDAAPAKALDTARLAAGGQDVRLGGGATVVRSFLAACGLPDPFLGRRSSTGKRSYRPPGARKEKAFGDRGHRIGSDLVAEVLALHGSPGAGKSTLARALALTLGEAGAPWGVIDMDELSLIDPYPGRSFPRENLRLIWPNYVAAVPTIKLIIPTVFADEGEVELLRDVLPGARLIICELTAPIETLKQRVTEREPTEELAVGLRRWIDVYHARTDRERIRNFQVTTCPATVDDSVHEILQLAGWT